jgi:Phage tail protein (Tail_P2_I)
VPRPTDKEVGSFALALYDQLKPLQYAESLPSVDFALLKYLGAIGQMLQDVDALAHDPKIPWSSILDIDRIPDEGLVWLGQFVGVQVNPELTPDEQRQQIRAHVGWNRGTVAALKSSIRYLLGGTRTVVVVERTPDAYSLTVNTYASETHADLTYQDYYDNYLTYELFYLQFDSYRQAWLAIQSNLIAEILNENKPAGLILTYATLPGAPGTLNSYATLFIKYDSEGDLMNEDQTYEDVYLELV